jgi:spore coat polysaccharide biosynthesis protein SpsF (cytidylyltransferase family)/sialic acid synthase SpsE
MVEIYNILEIANVHGGDMNYLKALLKDFESSKKNFGVKFQPFKYNEIALEDYNWYKTYKELYFSPKDWEEVINIAFGSKDVWIDVFDNYSIEIIKENLGFIYGLKFQASILNNFDLLNNLSKIDLTNLIIILNITSFSLDQIEEIINRVEDTLSPKEIVLQVGFQDYPTELLDSGLSKINVLKERFSNRISFADHIDAKNVESLYLPVVATILGAIIIEKHIKHSKFETKFDFYSSLSINEYKKYLQILKQYKDALNQPFINDKETLYLKKSLQKPILKKSFKNGQLINFNEDLDFKRTDQEGLNVYEIKEFINNFHVLSKDKNAWDTLMKEDFKKAIIATIIACRLKSTRLPKKALLKIGDLSSIELCIKNALKFEYVDYTILATSTLEEDSELKNHIFSDNVVFHRGDPDDVIQRYLDIIDKLKIDVVIRVTGDMPYVSNDILKILLRSHFESGADYTSAKKAATGTNIEIINSNALRKIKSYFPSADYSEYMTYYFTNNPSHFRLNLVDLPEYLVRDYRLTLDYEEDLKMFNLIEENFKKNNLDYNLNLLFDFLDNHPGIVNINNHLTLKYETDKKLIETLKRETTIKMKRQ